MSRIMRRMTLAGVVMGLALMASTHCVAGGSTGLYVGIGAGQIQGDDDFDDEASAAKVFAGYNFGWLPFLDLGAELSYLNGSELDGDVDGTSATLDIESLQAMGIAGFSFGPFGVYGKAGMADWDADRNGRGVSKDYSGTDPVYGFGARVQLFDVTGRLEVERIDADRIGHVDTLTGSVVYTF
ncbi:porin family protein [Halomonas sp. DP5Y7-2]|uniref:porin family protein n=1 Tax=Halomonas sp. DP5Y7-2 TaxID=2859076 RepID=UPI001C99B88E|nr:porin family protein [Halomonas sp. DP5Y7-2]MBY5983248.1 porin family protein [Halomonas sp. DP5Y7-2]